MLNKTKAFNKGQMIWQTLEDQEQLRNSAHVLLKMCVVLEIQCSGGTLDAYLCCVYSWEPCGTHTSAPWVSSNQFPS